MMTFGDKLKFYIAEKNYTVYKLSKLSGVERTSIHRALTGQRLLAKDSLDRIISFLNLANDERSDLLESYEIERIGRRLYYRRQTVQHIIETLAQTSHPQPSADHPEKRLYLSRHKFSCPSMIHGFYHMARFLQSLIEYEFYERDRLSIHLFWEPDKNFLNWLVSSLEILDFTTARTSVIFQQLIPFSKKLENPEKNHFNLEILDMLLPLSLSVTLDYELYYYYSSYSPRYDDGFIFPY